MVANERADKLHLFLHRKKIDKKLKLKKIRLLIQSWNAPAIRSDARSVFNALNEIN